MKICIDFGKRISYTRNSSEGDLLFFGCLKLQNMGFEFDIGVFEFDSAY